MFCFRPALRLAFFRREETMKFEQDFFSKEIRCGFEIPSLMKRTWAAQMEILQMIIDICDRNGLTYYADSGTLLGAVRHGGYIPWDDDIDIALKRHDYMKLIKILPHELPRGFIICGIHAPTPEWRAVVATGQTIVSAVRSEWKDIGQYMKALHGYPFFDVGVDIFPLDYIPRDSETYDIQNKLISYGNYIAANWKLLEEEKTLSNYIRRFGDLCGIPIENDGTKYPIFKMIDQLCALYGESEADEIKIMLFGDQIYFNKNWYDKTIELPFENMKIEVPYEYDKVLTAQYGDYRKPVRGMNAAHNYPFYKDMQKEMEMELKKVNVPYSLDDFCDKVISDEISVDWV